MVETSVTSEKSRKPIDRKKGIENYDIPGRSNVAMK